MTKKLLILKAPQRPKSNLESLKNDTYAMYGRGLVKQRAVAEAHLLYLNPKNSNRTIKAGKNIFIHFRNSVKSARPIIQPEYELLLVRGNYSQWQPLTKSARARVKMFYAADSDFWPRFWDPQDIDLVFVDEPKYGRHLRQKYPHLITPVLEKAVNEQIFRPRSAKKEYDICYVAGFMPWKNHNALFSAIAKFPEPWKIKVVLVGNMFDQDRIAWTLSFKYKVWFKWTGAVGSRTVADYIRRSKFCVFPGELDANPRALAESLACGVPVLVNRDITGGRHLINRQTGIAKPLHQFHQGIDYLLKNYSRFAPAEFFRQNLTLDKIIQNSFLTPLKKIKNN